MPAPVSSSVLRASRANGACHGDGGGSGDSGVAEEDVGADRGDGDRKSARAAMARLGVVALAGMILGAGKGSVYGTRTMLTLAGRRGGAAHALGAYAWPGWAVMS